MLCVVGYAIWRSVYFTVSNIVTFSVHEERILCVIYTVIFFVFSELGLEIVLISLKKVKLFINTY